MCEQSTSASKKTHACDCCQNQIERTEDMRGVRPMGASAVAGGLVTLCNSTKVASGVLNIRVITV
jgi:hypothetical protein